MFSKEFLNALHKVNGYGDKIILKYPQTVLNSPSNDVVVLIDAQSLGCGEFEDTGIYELSKFINMLGIFENAEVRRDENLLKIHSQTETAAFTLCGLDLLESHNLNPQLIAGLDKFPSVAEFTLSSQDIATIKKASSILNELNALEIKGLNSNTDVSLSLHNKFNVSSNEYTKTFLGTSNADFAIKLGVENIQKLPQLDYDVKVKYNAEKDAYRVIFINPQFTILISKLVD